MPPLCRRGPGSPALSSLSFTIDILSFKKRNSAKARQSSFLRCSVPACRAVQGIVSNSLVPWCKPDADFWFGIMNFAIYFPVICPQEEWAVC